MLLIYLPLRDRRPSWLTQSRQFTHKVVTCLPQIGHRSPEKKTDVLTTQLRRQISIRVHSLFAQDYLKDGMRARRVVVGRRHSRRPDGIAVLNKPYHVVDARDDFLLQSDHLNMLLAILEHSKLLLGIQQVKHLQTHNAPSCCSCERLDYCHQELPTTPRYNKSLHK